MQKRKAAKKHCPTVTYPPEMLPAADDADGEVFIVLEGGTYVWRDGVWSEAPESVD